MRYLIIIICLLLTGCQNVELGDIDNSLSQKYELSEIKNKYQLDGNKLVMEAKSNPKDRIEVAIGNNLLGGEGDFEPSLTISRWDEVSFTLIPSDYKDISSKELKFEGDKIKVETPKKDFIMYELPVSEELPEGGFEYQIDLKEKPESNIISFDFNTEGLEFYYQRELTQEEIDEGAVRPENVIGSYAVYILEDKINYEGGKEYKAGKVGHIYRPKIIDSKGWEVWGELNIKDGLLTVTIPQDFIDKAVYPIRHASGLTIGFTDKGNSNVWSSNKIRGNLISSTDNGNISSMTAYVNDWTAGEKIKCGIYLNANSFMSSTPERTTGRTGEGWETFTFSSQPTILNGNSYSIVRWHNNAIYYYYDVSATGHTQANLDITYEESWPETLNTTSDIRVSIYATYTLSDTCTYSGTGDWTVNLGDNCYINTNIYVSGDLILIDNTGEGSLNIIDGAILSADSLQATSTREYMYLESDDGSQFIINNDRT